MKKNIIGVFALVGIVAAITVGMCLLPGCSAQTCTDGACNVSMEETASIVADALSVALVPAVEIAMEQHPEYADLVAEVATQAAQNWPQGQTVTLTVVGDHIEQLLAERTDLTPASRSAIMGLLTSLRAGVRVYLNVRGYALPDVVTTDGAALMQQIAAVAATVPAQ